MDCLIGEKRPPPPRWTIHTILDTQPSCCRPGFKLEGSSISCERRSHQDVSHCYMACHQRESLPQRVCVFLEVSRTGTWCCELTWEAEFIFKSSFPSDRSWGFSTKNRVKFSPDQAPPLLGTPEPGGHRIRVTSCTRDQRGSWTLRTGELIRHWSVHT